MWNVIEHNGYSVRRFDRIINISLTIADSEGSDNIKPEHVSEAIQYRTPDKSWGKQVEPVCLEF